MFKKMILAATLLACTQPLLAAESAADSAATRPLFLRGEMNNWEAPQAQQLQQSEPGVLSAKAALQASHGAYKFKFADEKWKGDSTYGLFDPTSKVELGKPVIVKSGYQWGDIKFTPPADGTYEFVLDRRDATKLQVTVKAAN